MHGSKWLQGSYTVVLYFTMERLEGKDPLYDTFHHYTQDTAYMDNDYTTFISSLVQSSFIMILFRFDRQLSLNLPIGADRLVPSANHGFHSNINIHLYMNIIIPTEPE